ncbi:hypothetical protein [Phormidesmis priestleyi]|uniref:hypothetical protein n=1 Tax=Phormidesmis priestleyi TaxID=268141 RepID=UPI0015E6AFAF|nr:hypothetical protein [Phormidesmis priestleyi]
MEISSNQYRWRSLLLHLAIAGAAIAGVITMQRIQLNKSSLWSENPQQAEQQETLRLDLLQKSPTFGFDNLIADWAFLNFLQYYGDDEARKQTGYSLSPQYFDLITRRDPRFVDSYLFLSGTLSYQLGEPKRSLKYLKRGTDALSPQNHPRAFTVWRYAALDQLLLLGDTPSAIHSLEMASKWANDVPEYGEAAAIFQETANFLKTDPDSRLVRFQAWSSVYQQAEAMSDRKTQARAKQEILALGGVEKVDAQGRHFFAFSQPTKPQPNPPGAAK